MQSTCSPETARGSRSRSNRINRGTEAAGEQGQQRSKGRRRARAAGEQEPQESMSSRSMSCGEHEPREYEPRGAEKAEKPAACERFTKKTRKKFNFRKKDNFFLRKSLL